MNYYRIIQKWSIAAFLFAALLFVGCEGAEGPAGPVGAMGTPGTPGANGQQGTQGRQGTQGPPGSVNAKIVSFSFSTNNLSKVTDRVYRLRHEVLEITNEILEQGAVLSYLKTNSLLFPLPFADPAFDIAVWPYFRENQTTIDFRSTDGNARDKLLRHFPNQTEFEIRLLVIPPATGKNASKILELLEEGYTPSYEEALSLLNLTDPDN